MSRRNRSTKVTRDRVAFGALTLTLVVAPQLLGGVFGWGIALIAALAAITGSLAAAATRGTHALRPWLGALALALLGWTALQATPLPRAVASALQPLATEVWDDAARLLGGPAPSWIPLSLSPHDTWTEVLKLGAVACVFFASMSLATRSWRRAILVAAAGSVALMAAVALCHLAAGAESVFGLYQPRYAARILVAPLMNRNHLAGFLGMGVPLMLCLALDAPSPARRGGWFAAAVVTGVTVLLAASRGGVASLACGITLVGLLGVARKKSSGGQGRSPLILIGAATASLAGIGLYVASETLFRDFERGDLGKLELAGAGLGLALDHPWIGVGRGAFSSALVADHGAQYRYTHAENWLAHWSSEWGLVVTAVLVVAIAAAARHAIRRARSWPRVGAIAAVGSILTHDLVDFALEGLGVAVVAAAVAGAAIAPRRPKTAPSRLSSARLSLVALAVVTVGGVLLHGLSIDGSSRRALQAQLERELLDGEHEAFAATLERAVSTHPAEPTFFLLGGAEAVVRDDPAALPWLNQAMRAADGWSGPHAEAARFFARRGAYGQAFVEVREAELRQAGSAFDVACAVLEERPATLDTFVRVTRVDDVGTGIMDRVAHCLPLDSSVAVALDAQLLEAGGERARMRQARRGLAAGDHDEALASLASLDGTDEEVALLTAQIALAARRPADAVEALERSSTTSTRLLRLLAMAQARAGRMDDMHATIERLRGRAAGRADAVAEAWVLQGRLERSQNNDGAAMRCFERAHRIAPTSGAGAEIADLAEALGDLARAFRAHSEICLREGPGSAHCAARDRLERRSTERPLLRTQPTAGP